MATVTVDRFVDDYSQALRNGTAAIFAGAGLSVAAGFVDWKGLLRPLANDLKLSVEREHDLVRVAQYHVNEHHGRGDLENLILNRFSRQQAHVTESHRILARLPIRIFWTTNYDDTLERALEQAGKRVDVKHEQSQLPQAVTGRDAVVYKMHGDYRHSATAVLAKQDYEKYHLTRGDFLTALAGDLLSRTFLFIGFSFSDPNMDYVLSRMYAKHDMSQNKHFCLVAREVRREGESDLDHAYRMAQQDFFVRDLQRYNIRAVMLDGYDEVPEVLAAVEGRFKSRTVFVSGAAKEYGRLPAQDAVDFVHRLGDLLVARDYRLVTGLGLGIGSTLLDGALQQIYRVQKRVLRDQVVIRPFPQSAAGRELWTAYREDMLDFAGIALFLFGNKQDEGDPSPVPSPGVQEEFDIAAGKGVKVLPLGFTGFMARILYSRVAADFARYYPQATSAFRQRFDQLGDDALPLTEQLRNVVDALAELERM